MSEQSSSVKAVLSGCRSVLFDLDGTLLSTLDLKVEAAGQAFCQVLGCEAEAVKAAYRRISGIPRRALFQAVYREVTGEYLGDESFMTLSAAFSDQCRRSMHAGYLDPEAPETLRGLSERGLRLIVSSSAPPQDVQESVQMVNIGPFFDKVWGSISGFSKGKAHVGAACERYDLVPQEICMVGDDIADIQLGKQANVHTIAKVGTHSELDLEAASPDAMIRRLSELLSLLG